MKDGFNVYKIPAKEGSVVRIGTGPRFQVLQVTRTWSTLYLWALEGMQESITYREIHVFRGTQGELDGTFFHHGSTCERNPFHVFESIEGE